MNIKMQASPILVLLALVVIQVLFGVNYVISKIVVGAFPPLVWASVRIIISTALMMGACVLFKRKHPIGGKKFFLPLIVFALLGTIINQGSFLMGLRYTSATNSAILNTLIPVFTLLIVTIRGQEPLTLLRGMGFVFAFAGVLAIRKVEELSFSNQTMVGDLLTILNCLSYGFFLSYSKTFLEKYDRVWTTAWLFAYGSVGLTLLALPDWMSFQMPEVTPQLLWCMIFAIVGGTLMTYFLNIWTLAHTKSSSVALFIYLQPIVASALAYFWHGEPVTVRTLCSTGLIFLGFLLALTGQTTKPSVRAQQTDLKRASGH